MSCEWSTGRGQPEVKSSARRWSRVLVSRCFENAWCAGFWLLGRLRRRGPPRWSSTGQQRVCVIAPHPDDEAIGCGGVIWLHGQAGDDVAVVYVTDGGGSRAGGLPRADMVQRRRAEAEQACARLRVGCREWLGCAENAWEPDAAQQGLRAFFDRFEPEVVYAPSCVDFHPEHLKVAHVVAAALAGRDAVLVRVYPIQVPLTSVLVNRIAEVSAAGDAVRAALAAYATQRASLASVQRRRRYAASYYGAGVPHEPFWEMTSAEYRRIHALPPAMPGGGPFRGLRFLPVTDPLAYLVGRQARRDLLRRQPAASHSAPQDAAALSRAEHF